MKATETNLLQFLKGPKQFVIPIYQRTYSWTKKQCAQLWGDIERAAKNENLSGHFMGSVVYVEKGLYHVTSVPKLLVIDGQQRLTTLSLILNAFSQLIEEEEKKATLITAKKTRNYYLLNQDEEEEEHYKLLLTQKDRNTYIDLLEKRELDQEYSNRVVENHYFFKETMKRSELTLDEIYKGISKLIMVDISLDRDKDNPQLIFESLNSTGLDLSQADLIRNYFLMGLEEKEQQRLYKNYWYKLEKRFGHLEDTRYFDRFIRDYLTLKTGNIPKIGFVYEAFKSYVQQNPHNSIDEIIQDVFKYGNYYINLTLREDDHLLEEKFKDIRTLKVDVSYPFLLKVYDDYTRKVIDKEEFIEVLTIISSYVFRRAICGIPTNSLNNTFASFIKEVDESNYINSLKASLLVKTSYRRFPSNEEFKRELVIKDVYNFRNRNTLLRKLENFDRKEPISVENYTIEHIMPQNKNLSVEWQYELGSEWKQTHEVFLHTLGNLTLTGYNSELSDRSFQEKSNLKGGFKDSPLWLNRSIAIKEKWEESAIKERAKILAERALKVWPSPDLSEEELSKYRLQNSRNNEQGYSLNYHKNSFSPETFRIYEELKMRILNFDSEITEEFKKHYIAYKIEGRNFVDIEPLKAHLKIWLNVKANSLHDPHHLTKDVSNIGHRGNGDLELKITPNLNLEQVMDLIKQSYEHNVEYA
ncbi:Uncharacterized conserved protein, contains ParB-like and HNH nuclease domains [Thalassobacillus cyri]|uniref:Uncharacterized conserved protein, contains ParB-like and HNH nuclease domains n=1 Tax=Thalassobacillus cyri TaxID=571932 RepID=A0A1H3VYZ1_9BACI|nr:DUF262 and DUF1524 domain-containing protein [Thalassobacillus cyri]SDZ79282.1 Uncharacterized conserved protein, contains ParB-like and HNH nuclease domains [Thalassobacillus cyri]